MTKARKTLGTSGECSLDGHMAAWGWETIAANQRFRGGEIDRVFAKGPLQARSYCVAEVKTLRVRSVAHLQNLIGGDFLQSAFRARQCRNLVFWSRLLKVRGALQVHIRVFRVFRAEDACGADGLEASLRKRFSMASPTPTASPKVLRLDALSVALALTPVFVPAGQATSPLQISLP
ncbi:MAG: hypothetical protein IOD12_17125 [Silvanigrellales bacterium]|nr:hypothetical protein [Silvanigrellales bacterium]